MNSLHVSAVVAFKQITFWKVALLKWKINSRRWFEVRAPEHEKKRQHMHSSIQLVINILNGFIYKLFKNR